MWSEFTNLQCSICNRIETVDRSIVNVDEYKDKPYVCPYCEEKEMIKKINQKRKYRYDY